MGQLKRLAAAAATGVAIASTSIIATPVANGSTYVPLNSILRQCNWVNIAYTPSDTRGTAYAIITRNGSTVNAEVHVAGLTADIWYGVKLVQVPRPDIGCAAGDPGVAATRLYTDGAGLGTVTLSGPVMSGATGAWVSVEGPIGGGTMLSGDYRTSDFIAPI